MYTDQQFADTYPSLPRNIFTLWVHFAYTVCPRSSDPFYVVSYYIKLLLLGQTVPCGNSYILDRSTRKPMITILEFV